jgi:hypothetical protein
MPSPVVVYVDRESEAAARAALGDKVDIQVLDLAEGVMVLSQRAGYFDPGWWGDPRLVEVALKRARAEKRKKVKK